jgi:MSHA biogenesis protein MshP
MTPSDRLGRTLSRRRARGVSLITAVFLLVVLSGLVAALARVLIAQQATSAIDVLGARAYQAARSGLDWGIYQQLRVQPPSVACFASPQTFEVPSSDTAVRAFTVTVSCTAKAGNAVGDTTNRWSITAVACNTPQTASGCPNSSTDPDYVQRKVQAELN